MSILEGKANNFFVEVGFQLTFLSDCVDCHLCSEKVVNVKRKKKPSLQETLDLLQNLPSESSDALTNNSSDEVKRLNKTQELPLSSQPRRNFFLSIMKKLSSTPPESRLSQPSSCFSAD
ncbi:hypothetical protein TNCV_2839851 [Trichonephila clavipes]|nr:hypothetical protein TNCV_2839851 [Trichonephila clavipes]